MTNLAPERLPSAIEVGLHLDNRRVSFASMTQKPVAKSPPALITPELLVWAREKAGYTIAGAAQQLGVSSDKYDQWERGDLKGLTVSTLRHVARVFRRPLAVFYLEKPPRDLPKLKDYRRPSAVTGQEPSSPELLAAVRLAQSRRETALELAKDLGVPLKEFSLAATKAEKAKDIASRLRGALNVPAARERKWKSTTEATDVWRRAVESFDVLVFQAEELNKDEARGFSISEQFLPVIAIAGGEVGAGRIFTLMHEFAHLALRGGGICDQSDSEEMERFCNRVAGAILVPANELLREPGVREADDSTEWADEALKELADFFSVSEEVILRRLLILKRTSQEFYEYKRAEYVARYAKLSNFGRSIWHKRRLRALGRVYASLVLQAYHTDSITLSEVSEFLDTKLKYIPEIERDLLGPP